MHRPWPVYVKIVDEEAKKKITPTVLLYREFQNLLIDLAVEQTIFQSMSDKGLGPPCYYCCKDFRLEEFLDGRPLSIWEMRNEVVMRAYAEEICKFNFNQDAVDKLNAIIPIDRNNLTIDLSIDKWGIDLKARLPSMREKLMADGG